MMKSFKILFLLSLILIISESSCGKSEKAVEGNGASFNFENSQFSTKSLYRDIDQSKIKALRLSFRIIEDTMRVNSFLFKPVAREGNRTSLADLLLWAIEKKNLTAYNPLTEYFTEPITWEEIKRENIPIRIEAVYRGNDQMYDTIVAPANINTEEVKSYLLMESTIYGINNKKLEVRTIGLCPIRTQVDEAIGRISKRKLFWVYFPDIMNTLSNHFPETKIQGVKSTLDFFTKNRYQGEYLIYNHSNSPLIGGLLWGDTTRFVEGFDASWIYNKVKDGIYINPFNKFYLGQGRQEDLLNPDIPRDRSINPVSVASAKYEYKTIDLRNIENYPLYFPENPFFGQKSLIDVIYSGIKAGNLMVYQPSDESSPMTLKEVDEAMGKSTRSVQILNIIDGSSNDTLIQVDFTSSEVKKYIVKDAEFYDEKGILIDSRIIGLMPIREYKGEDMDKTLLKPLFFVPFNDLELKKLLIQNDPYRFTAEDNLSYLLYFQQKKYKTESFEIKPAVVSDALKESGLQR